MGRICDNGLVKMINNTFYNNWSSNEENFH